MSFEFVHSPGKLFTDPLFVTLGTALVALVMALRRTERGKRAPIVIALLAVTTLYLFSTALVTGLLAWSLRVAERPEAFAPEVIVVPSGGWVSDDVDLRYDVLSSSTEARVVAGVLCWQRHPNARIVMAGAGPRALGSNPHGLELMRDLAVMRGVPASRILIDGWSTSTREHPIGVLKLRGITRETPIAIATNDWHIRRTLGAFRRHFAHVTYCPTMTTALGPPDPVGLIPRANELRNTTSLAQEWIGIAWYALRR